MKTLKDIEFVVFEPNKNFSKKSRKFCMKTLHREEDLKQSAIEDIKEILERNNFTIDNIGYYEMWGFTTSESALILIDYIMKKFNLTKEI